MVCRIPGELAEKSCLVLGELVGGSTNVTDETQWEPLFKYLSSVSVGFLSSSAVFHSVAPVGSLTSLL
jgi:hypothetical protein